MVGISRTGIIDYGVGNLRSVSNAIENVGGTPVVSSSVSQLQQCDRLILPGVGAFGHGIKELRKRGLDQVVYDAATVGKPILGICLGMQMLTACSYEFGKTEGLGLVAGEVKLLESSDEDKKVRLPHVSWNRLHKRSASCEWLFEGVNTDAQFYFIHSFGVQGHPDNVIAWAEHEGIDFAAVIANENVTGTQFHPEKSGPNGLRLLRNFIRKGD